MQNQVRSMLEGALLSGIFLVLMFLSLYTPIGIVTAMALPVPFTIYAARNDVKKALLMVLASTLLAFLIGSVPSIFSALLAGLLGTVMGTLYYRKKSAFIVLTGGVLTYIMILLGGLLVSFFFLNINPITSMQQMMSQSIQMSQSIVGQFGSVDPKTVELLKKMVELIPKIIPFLLISSSVIIALINHALSRKILHRLGVMVSQFPPFREWSWPKSILYYCLVVLGLSIFLKPSPDHFLYLLILNSITILYFMMMIQGLSLLTFYSHQRGWGRGIPILAIVLVFLFPPFPFILVLLGILDLGMNLRKQPSKK